MQRIHREFATWLEKQGATDIALSNGGKHVKVDFTWSGEPFAVTVSSTPSDLHALNAMIREATSKMREHALSQSVEPPAYTPRNQFEEEEEEDVPEPYTPRHHLVMLQSAEIAEAETRSPAANAAPEERKVVQENKAVSAIGYLGYSFGRQLNFTVPDAIIDAAKRFWPAEHKLRFRHDGDYLEILSRPITEPPQTRKSGQLLKDHHVQRYLGVTALNRFDTGGLRSFPKTPCEYLFCDDRILVTLPPTAFKKETQTVRPPAAAPADPVDDLAGLTPDEIDLAYTRAKNIKAARDRGYHDAEYLKHILSELKRIKLATGFDLVADPVNGWRFKAEITL